MNFSEVLLYILSGISVGGQYALIAIGYTMMYGILCVVLFRRKGIMGDKALDVERIFGRRKKETGGGQGSGGDAGEVSGNG